MRSIGLFFRLVSHPSLLRLARPNLHPVDRFLAKKLEMRLFPSQSYRIKDLPPDSFCLLGMPPTPDEAKQFLNDQTESV